MINLDQFRTLESGDIIKVSWSLLNVEEIQINYFRVLAKVDEVIFISCASKEIPTEEDSYCMMRHFNYSSFIHQICTIVNKRVTNYMSEIIKKGDL